MFRLRDSLHLRAAFLWLAAWAFVVSLPVPFVICREADGRVATETALGGCPQAASPRDCGPACGIAAEDEAHAHDCDDTALSLCASLGERRADAAPAAAAPAGLRPEAGARGGGRALPCQAPPPRAAGPLSLRI